VDWRFVATSIVSRPPRSTLPAKAHIGADRGARRRFSRNTAGYLLRRRKAASGLLRECEPVVNANLEDAAARASNADLCRGSQLEDLFPRLTGARFIASSPAVFDLDFHRVVLNDFDARRLPGDCPEERDSVSLDTSYPRLTQFRDPADKNQPSSG
jgi:hypothetical protein